jgi:pentatricopeptide repeat protein
MSLTLVSTREHPSRAASSEAHARPQPLPAERQRPTITTIRQLQTQVFETIIDFQTSTVKISEKVKIAKNLKTQVAHLRSDCAKLQEESEKEIDDLPFYCILDKCSFWLTKRQLWPLNSYNQNSEAYSTVRTTLKELNARIHNLVQKKLELLNRYQAKSCEESFDIVSFYDELSELEPENSLPLEGMANWLLQERAYQEAEKVLAILIGRQPNKHSLQLQLISALIGKGDYAKAEEKISLMKLSLTLDEQNKPREITPPVQQALTQLDELKADCFAHQNKYEEALDILREMQKKDPQNNRLIQKIVLFTVRQEIEPLKEYDELSPAQQKFFLASAKQMFARMDEYRETAFSKDNLISDVEFWLDVLFSQVKLYENRKIKEFILLQIKDLVESGHVTQSLVVKKIEARLIALTEAHKSFEERFYSFVQNSVVPREARQTSILKARRLQLEHTLNGDSSLTGSIGLIRKKELAELILKNLCEHRSFQGTANKVTLLCLAGRIESQGAGIAACKKSFLQLQQADSSSILMLSSS